MKNNVTIVFLMLLICLWGASCRAEQEAESSAWPQSEQPEESGNQEPVKTEISMEQAIALAMEEANKDHEYLQLTEVHSYDNDSAPCIGAGADGKRQWWYVSFGNDNLDYVDILIADGEIVSVHSFQDNGNNGLFSLSDLALTSETAAAKAMELGLRGGDPENGEQEWVSGYNFKLEYGSLAADPDTERLLLDVIGVSRNRNFARISFDAATGEALLAMEKLEHETGETEWIPLQTGDYKKQDG